MRMNHLKICDGGVIMVLRLQTLSIVQGVFNIKGISGVDPRFVFRGLLAIILTDF
jgi:hypothetical protein